MVKFNANNHLYESVNPQDNVEWLSVTKLVSRYKSPFDPVEQSKKSSKNKRSKWYGMDPEVIQNIWASESKRSVDLGNWYHDQRESDISSLNTINRSGVDIPIIKCIYDDGVKYAPDQRLTEGIYPEHFVYLKAEGICGQSDRVEVVNGFVDVIDYKTNKEIKKESYKSWDGKSQKMLAPIEHLDDCNYIHYNLQLSIYMYMILRQNPNLKPGKLTIQHVKFKEDSEKDAYGYPLILKDHQGDPIVQEIIPYELPYLRNDVIKILDHHKKIK